MNNALLIGTCVIVSALTITAFHFLFTADFTSVEKEKCEDYQRQGSLKVGTCDCVAKLYHDKWSESYDWIDACAILEATK
jgi:hypothetical protein